MRFLKISHFKRDHNKGNLMFSLHPVTFYGQNCENQKCVEVVASLFKLQDMLTKIYFLVLAFES